MIEQNPHLTTLCELIDDYHITMRASTPEAPPKPQSEHKVCIEQIYGYAKVHGISGSEVDDLMDQAEKKYVLSQQ